MRRFFASFILSAIAVLIGPASAADLIWPQAKPSLEGEHEGPFKRLIIENATLIDGTGAPPVGPVTIVVERGKITQIYGLPGMYTAQVGENGIPAREGDHRIDATGHYVLPGLIDSHTRVIDRSIDPNTGNTSRSEDAPPDYTLKLLVAHGVTTIASMQPLAVIDWAKDMKASSEANRITGPNIEVWVDFPAANEKEARAGVREALRKGAVGLGEGDVEGSVRSMLAAIDEAKKVGLPTYWCLHDNTIQQMSTIDWARAGLSGWPHARGLPDSLYEDRDLVDYPANYNYSNPETRWKGGRWDGVVRGSQRWNDVIDELVAMDFTLGPTFVVYEALRDYTGASRAEWHEDYLHPALRKSFEPGTNLYSSEFVDWGTTDEIEWKRDFDIWMDFVNDFKNKGGRVVAGSDAGYFWTIPGFALIRNMELLQEAGFSPLEVIRSATLDSAEWLGIDERTGSVEIGKDADLLIVEKNPLDNLKVLYGTGIIGKRVDGTVGRVGGVKYTIKRGVIYDAPTVLANVKNIVKDAE